MRLILVRAEMPGPTPALHARVEAEERRVERDRPGRLADRQVAGDPVVVAADVLDRGRAEGHEREVLGVEEVGRTEVAVARAVRGVDRAGRDRAARRGTGSAPPRRGSRVPSISANVPRTVVTIMCLAENRMSVWAASIAQVVAVVALVAGVAGVMGVRFLFLWRPLRPPFVVAHATIRQIVALSTIDPVSSPS